MPPIELRAPTSFLFFVASAYIAREAIALPPRSASPAEPAAHPLRGEAGDR